MQLKLTLWQNWRANSREKQNRNKLIFSDDEIFTLKIDHCEWIESVPKRDLRIEPLQDSNEHIFSVYFVSHFVSFEFHSLPFESVMYSKHAQKYINQCFWSSFCTRSWRFVEFINFFECSLNCQHELTLKLAAHKLRRK